jgi:murein DD-endopeptidase MepM/ murein hydrolase activator NlpD
MMSVRNPGANRIGCLPVWAVLGAFLVVIGLTGYHAYRSHQFNLGRTERVLSWLRNARGHAEWSVQPGERCADAPFQMPTAGYIGYIWGDSFRVGHQHQGIDIFGGAEPGVTPVYAAYSGYLSRQSDWKSSLIIRIAEDPLQPGRQIWTYYTHMASPDGQSYISADFPPGVQEVPVDAGTLLGYQGNFSGTPGNPVGVHLHFSIVKDNGQGLYLNELEIDNTLDPSPYLGLPLNAYQNQEQIPVCQTMNSVSR